MSVLTVPQAPYHINKITELARDPRPVSAFSDTFFILANQSSDPDIQKLAASWIVHYKFEEAIKNSSESKVVMCESTSSLQYILRFKENQLKIYIYVTFILWRSRFTENGKSTLYIMKEGLFHFGVSFVLQKDSPYTERLKPVCKEYRIKTYCILLDLAQ